MMMLMDVFEGVLLDDFCAKTESSCLGLGYDPSTPRDSKRSLEKTQDS